MVDDLAPRKGDVQNSRGLCGCIMKMVFSWTSQACCTEHETRSLLTSIHTISFCLGHTTAYVGPLQYGNGIFESDGALSQPITRASYISTLPI